MLQWKVIVKDVDDDDDDDDITCSNTSLENEADTNKGKIDDNVDDETLHSTMTTIQIMMIIMIVPIITTWKVVKK